MASDTTFQGFLLAYVKGNEETPFPEQFIDWDSWESNDSQREYIKAYRDDNTRNLTLVQAQGRKTALKLKTRDNLRLDEVKGIRDWFLNGQTDNNIRQITIKYWDSDQLKYRIITCYQANPKFEVKKIITEDTGRRDGNGKVIYRHDLLYKGRTIDLVEM